MKKYIIYMLFLCIAILGNVLFLTSITNDEGAVYSDVINIEISLKSEMEIETPVQLFYSETGEFSEIASLCTIYNNFGEAETINYDIGANNRFFRIDFGSQENEFEISEFTLRCKDIAVDLLDEIKNNNVVSNMVEITSLKYLNNSCTINSTGNDPYLIFDLSKTSLEKKIHEKNTETIIKKKILICIAWNFLFLLVLINRSKISKLLYNIFGDKGLLLDLAKNDFKTKFAGSYLGITWAFVQPIVTILVYWFVFQVGFRSGMVQDVPFVLWLTAGLVPWFFLNDALNSATASLLEYSYLVKKVVFKVEIIPLVRILSSFFVHIFFVGFMLLMFVINDIVPRIEWIQIIYYSVCLTALLIGISYLTSALVVFFRDLAQIIIIVLQIGMWVTPIMWQWSIMPKKVLFFLKLNPVYYIVEGYRNSLIYGKWFWNDTYMTIYFWIFTLICIILGTKIFAKLKIHFADVL